MSQNSEVESAAGEGATPHLSWKRALALSALAVYGPFVVMALYTQAFVACKHCKSAVWIFLLPGPAVAPWQIAHNFLDLPQLSKPVFLTLAMFTVAAGIVLAAALSRRGRRWSIWVLSATAMVASAMAFLLLAFIRA